MEEHKARANKQTHERKPPDEPSDLHLPFPESSPVALKLFGHVHLWFLIALASETSAIALHSASAGTPLLLPAAC